MNYQAIIFDMDGTIIETEHIWHQATHSLITSRGHTITPEIKETLSHNLAGLSSRESCSYIKKLFNLPDHIERLMHEKNTHANSLYAEGIRFINGFISFQEKAKALNLKMGLATNAMEQTIEVTNQVLNLTQFFGEHIYGISHVQFKGKPHPAIYTYAAEKLEVQPQACIAIEDSAHGIEAAQRAGMFCIGINTSGRSALLAKADLIINHYDEIALEAILRK